MLDAAPDLRTLAGLPGNRLGRLKCHRSGIGEALHQPATAPVHYLARNEAFDIEIVA
jgi:hypothetical protein